jgi:hypothetical protein
LKKEWKMSNYNHVKRAMVLACLAAGFGVAKPASAMAVYDATVAANTGATATATITNAALTGAILLKIKNIDRNVEHMTGTVDHIDGTLDHISGVTDHISGNTDIIVGTQNHIDSSTQNISNQTDYNTYNSKTVSLITNNYYGGDDGIIPILSDNGDAKFLSGATDTKTYQSSYADAATYKDRIATAGNLSDASVNESANRKNANDILVDTLNDHRNSLRTQSQQIGNLSTASTTGGSGTNDMLRYSNALASAGANQMVEMRSLMLAQANAQAAEQQANLDTDARHIASSQSLRSGLKMKNATESNVQF